MNNPQPDPIDEFHRLCSEAEAAYSRADSRGDPELLPFVERILVLIVQNPNCQPEFEQAFQALWNREFSGPWELIPYCMHKLRWHSFRGFMVGVLNQAKDRKDWRCMFVASKVLAAFKDDWNA